MTHPDKDSDLTDSRTPYQKAVDIAWRTEKIGHLLRERGEADKADMAAIVMINIFPLVRTMWNERIIMLIMSVMAMVLVQGSMNSHMRQRRKQYLKLSTMH